MKSYSLENSLGESIFREDLFLYNWLQKVTVAAAAAEAPKKTYAQLIAEALSRAQG